MNPRRIEEVDFVVYKILIIVAVPEFIALCLRLVGKPGFDPDRQRTLLSAILPQMQRLRTRSFVKREPPFVNRFHACGGQGFTE